MISSFVKCCDTKFHTCEPHLYYTYTKLLTVNKNGSIYLTWFYCRHFLAPQTILTFGLDLIRKCFIFPKQMRTSHEDCHSSFEIGWVQMQSYIYHHITLFRCHWGMLYHVQVGLIHSIIDKNTTSILTIDIARISMQASTRPRLPAMVHKV